MTPASAATFTYDAPAFARFDVHEIDAAEAGPARLRDAQAGSASPYVEGRRTPTTSQAGSVATNTAGQRALPRSSLPTPSEAAEMVRTARPVGSGLKPDAMHDASTFGIEKIASQGSVFRIVGGDGVSRTLIQVPEVGGRCEWIVDDGGDLTHHTSRTRLA